MDKETIKKGVRAIAYASGGRAAGEAVDSLIGSDSRGGGFRSQEKFRVDKENKTKEDEYSEHGYDRLLLKAYGVLWAVALVLVLLGYMGVRVLGIAGWVLALALVVYLVVSFRVWSRDYEVVDVAGIEVIKSGPMFRYSLLGGRASDPFVDLENKMIRYLKQLGFFKSGINERTCSISCTDITEGEFVFSFDCHTVVGVYESLKGCSSKLATMFGDPDGAVIKKSGEGVYEVRIDRMADRDLSSNVRWSDEEADVN